MPASVGRAMEKWDNNCGILAGRPATCHPGEVSTAPGNVGREYWQLRGQQREGKYARKKSAAKGISEDGKQTRRFTRSMVARCLGWVRTKGPTRKSVKKNCYRHESQLDVHATHGRLKRPFPTKKGVCGGGGRESRRGKTDLWDPTKKSRKNGPGRNVRQPVKPADASKPERARFLLKRGTRE